MKIFILLSFTYLLVGCSALGFRSSVSESNLQKINNIGIATALTDSFHMIHIGATIFTNEYNQEEVPEWKIDEYVRNIVINELSATGKYQIDVVSGKYLKNSSYNNVDYKKLIKLANNQGYDTLVVVNPTYYDNLPHHKGGYGFYERNHIIGTVRCLYSLFKIDVVDVQSNKKIASRWYRPCDRGDEDIMWKKELDNYSELEKKQLEKRVKRDINRNLIRELEKLNLI